MALGGRGRTRSALTPELNADPASQVGGQPLPHPIRKPGEEVGGGRKSGLPNKVKRFGGLIAAVKYLLEHEKLFNLSWAQFMLLFKSAKLLAQQEQKYLRNITLLYEHSFLCLPPTMSTFKMP